MPAGIPDARVSLSGHLLLVQGSVGDSQIVSSSFGSRTTSGARRPRFGTWLCVLEQVI